MIALSDQPFLAPGVRAHTDPVTAQPVLLYPEGILILNESASAVVELCDGARTIEGIVAHLAAEFEATDDELKSDVLACVADLRERNLLVMKS
ncbi:MAG TPA: pyrroloquinoline quinone biosynthesis peptide chaperone PqqD [Chthoniobacteraceae bacterium]|nr:pyrroloquinoline quinone biosynthesis peptide chaperone PqqD [Chthoniobacteraceae bacterium]